MNLAEWWDTKPTFRKWKHFCTSTLKYQRPKLGKNPICYSNKKNKVPRYKPNQGGKRSAFRKLHNTEEKNEERHKQNEANTVFTYWKNEHHQNVHTTQNNL